MNYQFFAFPQDLVLSDKWAELSFKAKSLYVTLGSLVNRRTNQSWFTNKFLAKKAGISDTKIPSAAKELVEKRLIRRWKYNSKIYYSIVRELDFQNESQEDSGKKEDFQNESQKDRQTSKMEAENRSDFQNESQKDISYNKRNLRSVCTSLTEKFLNAIGQPKASERIKTHTTSVIKSLLKEGYSEDDISFTIDYVIDVKGKENVYSAEILPYFMGEALGKRPEVEKKIQQRKRKEEIEAKKEEIQSKMDEIMEKVAARRREFTAEQEEEYIRQAHHLLDSEGISKNFRFEPIVESAVNQIVMEELGLDTEYSRLKKMLNTDSDNNKKRKKSKLNTQQTTEMRIVENRYRIESAKDLVEKSLKKRWDMCQRLSNQRFYTQGQIEELWNKAYAKFGPPETPEEWFSDRVYVLQKMGEEGIWDYPSKEELEELKSESKRRFGEES